MYFGGQTFERKIIMTLRSACLFDNGDIYQDSGLALPPLPLRSTNIKNKLHTPVRRVVSALGALGVLPVCKVCNECVV